MRMHSRTSSSVIGGKMPGRQRAENVLPEPGEPTSKKLWAPAAAISKARLTPSIPITERKSDTEGSAAMTRCEIPPARTGITSEPGAIAAMHSARVDTPTMESPDTRLASATFSLGTTKISSFFERLIATDRTPCTALTQPSRESSPKNTKRSGSLAWISSLARSIPTASGKSRDVPSFRKSAGERFTVIRLPEAANPALRILETTRSLDSRTALSGNPTSVKPGSPAEESTSTFTGIALIPSRQLVRILWNTRHLRGGYRLLVFFEDAVFDMFAAFPRNREKDAAIFLALVERVVRIPDEQPVFAVHHA